MKLGLFATWLSESAGGIENMCYNLFLQIRKSHEVRAFSLHVPEEEMHFDNVYYAKTAKRTVPFLSYLRAYAREARKGAFDLNIAMHWATGLVTLLIQFFTKTPYVLYVYAKEIAFFPTPIHKFFVKLVLKNAREIIAISEYTRALCGHLTKTPVTIVHPGIGNEAFEALPGTHTLREGTSLHMYTISRLVKRKGIDTAIKAVKELVDEGFDIQYRIAGSGSYEGELKKLVQDLALEGHIAFLGRVSTQEKYAQYALADLFVMPSYEIASEREVEGFGIVYIEANAQGKFVIAGNSGGIPDAVLDGQTGYLVNGESPSEIKEAILKYYNRSVDERASLSKKCVDWAKAHRWEVLIEDCRYLDAVP